MEACSSDGDSLQKCIFDFVSVYFWSVSVPSREFPPLSGRRTPWPFTPPPPGFYFVIVWPIRGSEQSPRGVQNSGRCFSLDLLGVPSVQRPRIPPCGVHVQLASSHGFSANVWRPSCHQICTGMASLKGVCVCVCLGGSIRRLIKMQPQPVDEQPLLYWRLDYLYILKSSVGTWMCTLVDSGTDGGALRVSLCSTGTAPLLAMHYWRDVYMNECNAQ